MKAVLSRKGYDDKYGGRPSAIMPNGQMLSFPIPIPEEVGIASDKISYDGTQLNCLLEQLGHTKTNLNHHLDPDLGQYCVDGRPSKCAGVFGRSHSAGSHLDNQGIGPEDIFLFFGTFQHVDEVGNGFRYRNSENPFHAIFGYLVVSEIIEVTENLDASFGAKRFLSHPHWPNKELPSYVNNRLYVGNRYGTFTYSDELRLTKPNSTKSLWQLPHEFIETPLSYHPNGGTITDGKFELQSASIGQEFVFSATDNQKIWINHLINKHG